MNAHDSAGAGRTGSWQFDHVNVTVAGQAASVRILFEHLMGLAPGARPPFPFPGTWLYQDDRAIVHTVDRESALEAVPGTVRFGHIAFRTDEAAATLKERVRASGLPFRIAHVPGTGALQIFIQLSEDFVVELTAAEDAAGKDGNAAEGEHA
ncbi:hypothetical protein BJN34_30760 [Cupriavidus necator]|uniref:VOC domain-containing protein n=1 Tax=Cupriavidus necator TaxID=106590 RepID=A0A1U9UZW3_CUPNE|nr:hypothetical protein [Cupriavidus necator]AQV98254.1 hypothetical protein BJN34_30760 [Cupriavidus necator]